jgi:hypothetical protein
VSLDSDDVVERLRTWTSFGTNVLFVRDLNAAIAEIGSLRAERAAFRRAIAEGDGPFCEDVCLRECVGVCGVA